MLVRVNRAELRSTLYHRLHGLWPVLAHPVVRGLAWLIFALWLLFVVLVLGLRYVVLPSVGNYQLEIEQAVAQAVGQPVKIGKIEARWQGLNPDLVLNDLEISDNQGRPSFTLAQVDTVLSWQSLWRGRLMLSLLAVEGPVLHVRRETDGRITIAGIETKTDNSDPSFADWILRQGHIRIRNATIVWEDRLRQAPPLVLEDLQFGLDNSGRRHRFGLSAAPPEALAARIDFRGEVEGDVGEALERLAGKLFVELEYADLAGWRPWLDYPIDLPQGRGALRVWGDLSDGESKLTADFALEELRIRLGKSLPELDMANMRGRLEGRYKPNEWAVSGYRIELLTLDGVRVPPTDFHAEWRRNAANGRVTGETSATLLDLGALSALAAYLPLDVSSRELLVNRHPAGRVAELRSSWELADEKLLRYALKASFSELGLRSSGKLPGATGLSGTIDLNEKSGWLALEAKKSSFSLPAVFPEPDIALDEFRAKASWKVDAAGQTDVRLEKLEFAGPDAAATARGTYLYRGDGPGEIDLTANISRGEGSAVWRYMPHAVNANARAWLRRGIVGGRGYDGKLVLKGNLRDFPFRDPRQGTFYVTAKAAGAKIDYADGWPAIEQIDGEMQFGVGMKITAKRGKILGADLSNVLVVLPDFESHEEMLYVRGAAEGPTSEFLRFIDQSPVGDKIDRFTDGMKALGNGRLDLELDLPLRRIADAKVRGEYFFHNNQVQALAGLPFITQVNGRLSLTEKSVLTNDIAGRLFGGPMKLRVRNEADKVAVQATGQANIAAVREHFAWPVLAQVTGSSAWKADINIRRRNADFVIESNLLGLSSALPDPFNKTANTPLPLRIERTTPDATREQFRVSLGKVARGLLVQRTEASGTRWERAVINLGEGELRLPDKGLNVMVTLPRVDGDAWRNAFTMPLTAANSPSAATSGGLALGQVMLKTPSLRLFGREFSHVDASLKPREGGWLIGLNMREAVGELLWRSAGEGLLEGRLKRLLVQSSAEGSEAGVQLINSLPGMNVTVDEFFIGEKALGQLEVKARNEKGAWQLENVSLKNSDGQLKGRGTWQNQGKHQTHLEFDLGVSDIGKMLSRLGYVDAVRRGQAKLTGGLDWEGPLTTLHYPSLTGNMTIHAEKGQFNKLEPGIGKLLGLISLQSLPRRLTLDFRDIFSDGLAFDRIDGKVAIKKGIMRTTEPLRINGPAAKIEMQGETDLKNETQNLRVTVRPEIGGAAAMGAALVNPVIGVATLLANTVLSDPLNRLFSYRYQVSGSWSDPQIDKAGPPEEVKAVPNEGGKP